MKGRRVKGGKEEEKEGEVKKESRRGREEYGEGRRGKE